MVATVAACNAGGYSSGTPSDPFVVLSPTSGPDPTKYGVIALHGATQPCTQLLDSSSVSANYTQRMLAAAAAGLTIVSPYVRGDQWGNDTAIGLVSDAYAYLQALGCRQGKVLLVGYSMGGLTSYCWARANLGKVAGFVGLEPVSDPSDIQSRNPNGLAASLNAAYGGNYVDSTNGPTHNPGQFASQLANLPAQVWYATDDQVVAPATVTKVTNAIPTADVHTLTGGHSDTAIAGVDVATMVGFLLSHAGS